MKPTPALLLISALLAVVAFNQHRQVRALTAARIRLEAEHADTVIAAARQNYIVGLKSGYILAARGGKEAIDRAIAEWPNTSSITNPQ